MNTSGIHPTEYNVLVEPYIAEQKTAGGLILPEEVVDKDGKAQTRGRIVDTGPMAFAFDDWPKDKDDQKPQIGQAIYFARYAAASSRITGKDDKEYWLIKDRDILATIED
jgi:co-chaperonin GroES (HSP10)